MHHWTPYVASWISAWLFFPIPNVTVKANSRVPWCSQNIRPPPILPGLVRALPSVLSLKILVGGVVQVTVRILNSWLHPSTIIIKSLQLLGHCKYGNIVTRSWVLSLKVEYTTLETLDYFPSYLAEHLFFQRFQRIKIGVDMIRSLWTSFFGFRFHHFIKTLLKCEWLCTIPKNSQSRSSCD